MRTAWAVAAAAAVLNLLIGSASHTTSGLKRVSDVSATGALDVQNASTIKLPSPLVANGTVAWSGSWEVGEGVYDLVLESSGDSSWTIDGVEVLHASGTKATRTVWLGAGFHTIKIAYRAASSRDRLVVAASRAGQPPEALPPDSLMPAMPKRPWLHSLGRTLRAVTWWIALIAFVWALRLTVLAAGDRLRGGLAQSAVWRSAWASRALAWSALAVILAFGALLRIDAIAGRFDVVPYPGWLRAIETRTIAPPASIRPASVTWSRVGLFPHSDGPPTHYRSDPYTYLQAARTRTSFYAAHFREPVFPYVTKISLGLLGDQDVAVSLASTACSLLAVWFTYLLGAAVWSRPAGLAAAFLLAVDPDAVSLASLGWRDDLYVAAFAICAYFLLRYERTANIEPPRVYRLGRWQVSAWHADAVLLGIGGGLAILTRIMAVPFLLAGAGWILISHRGAWRTHAAGLAIAVMTAAVVAAPYFVNCWRVFGDPLYTFNVHGAIYSAAEGRPGFKGSTASFVRNEIARRPIYTVDTVTQGITTYPFGNKFHGLNHWVAGIDRWIAVASLVGLMLLAGFPAGRLLIVVTVAALLPFSLTWTVDPDYRFTLFAYPTLAIAAAVAASAAARVLLAPRADTAGSLRAFRWGPWAATVGAAIVLVWFVEAVSPSLVVAEALRDGQDVSVTAGDRDSASFGRGWSDVITTGNVRSRVVTGEAVLRLRLPASADYPATVRMDPFPRPTDPSATRLPSVEFVLNGTSIATMSLGVTTDRVGSYDFVLPRAAVRQGTNELVVRVARATQNAPGVPAFPSRPGLSDGDAASLWYIRLHPAR